MNSPTGYEQNLIEELAREYYTSGKCKGDTYFPLSPLSFLSGLVSQKSSGDK